MTLNMQLIAMMLGLCAPFFHPGTAASQTNLSRLPLAFPAQSPEVIAYFNQIARPEDTIYTLYRFRDLLSQVTVGRKVIGFTSWADAEQELPHISEKIDGVMYDPEHWSSTPKDEQQNLPATIKKASEFTHARNLPLFVAPDRRFVDEYLADFAPDVDAVILQGQRLQNNPGVFSSWIKQKIAIARAANPNIIIYVQVGATRDTPAQMLAAIQTVSDQIDGVAIWSMPASLASLQEFVKLAREAPPTTGSPPTGGAPTPAFTTPQPTQNEATSSPTQGIATLTASPTPPSVVEKGMPASGLMIALILCAVVLLLAFSLILIVRRGKDRRE